MTTYTHQELFKLVPQSVIVEHWLYKPGLYRLLRDEEDFMFNRYAICHDLEAMEKFLGAIMNDGAPKGSDYPFQAADLAGYADPCIFMLPEWVPVTPKHQSFRCSIFQKGIMDGQIIWVCIALWYGLNKSNKNNPSREWMIDGNQSGILMPVSS